MVLVFMLVSVRTSDRQTDSSPVIRSVVLAHISNISAFYEHCIVSHWTIREEYFHINFALTWMSSSSLLWSSLLFSWTVCCFSRLSGSRWRVRVGAQYVRRGQAGSLRCLRDVHIRVQLCCGEKMIKWSRTASHLQFRTPLISHLVSHLSVIHLLPSQGRAATLSWIRRNGVD